MADCNETLNELFTYLDGELGANAKKAIAHHLDGCMDCLQAFDFHAELKTVIANKARVTDVPPGLLDRIRSCFGDDLGKIL